MTQEALNEFYRQKGKLSRDQKLVKSVIQDCMVSNRVSLEQFDNIEQMYQFRRKYKNYLRIKRLIPLSLIAQVTGNELTRMAYAAALGSKSVSLTLPGLIGYSLPAFFFST